MAERFITILVKIEGMEFHHQGKLSEALSINLERTMDKGFNPGATLLGYAEQGIPESRVDLVANVLDFAGRDRSE